MKKIILGALLVLVIGIVGVVFTGGNVLSVGDGDKIDQEKTVAIDGVKNLEVKMDIGELHIKASNNDKIEAHLYGNIAKNLADDLEFKLEKQGDTVVIRVNTPEIKKAFNLPFFNMGNNTRKLDVFVPKMVLDDLKIDSNVGEIQVGDITTNYLSLSSDVGKVRVDKFSGEAIAIESNVGDVQANVIKGKVNVQTDTGKVDITLKQITNDVSIKSDVGEVDVTIEEEPENLSLDLDSGVGEVNVKGFKEFNTSSHNHVQSNIGQGGPVIKVRTDVGEINVSH